jgi:class 3 adenylate cyclase
MKHSQVPVYNVSTQVRASRCLRLFFPSCKLLVKYGAGVQPGTASAPDTILFSARWSPVIRTRGKGWCGMLTAPDPGISASSGEALPIISGLVFRFLTAIDIEDFSRRPAVDQAKLHDDLEYAMSEAAASTGLDRKVWYRELRGDGELAVLPADTNGLSLVADYPRRLASVFAEINRAADHRPRLRARMAIHHGTVYPSRFGPVSSGPTTVSRLVDAQVLRHVLRDQIDLDIALIVSAAVYNEIVQSRFGELDPAMFRRARTRIKGNSYIGYLYSANLCDSRSRPGRPAITAA